MKLPPFYDVIAALVTLVLLMGVIIYPLCGQDVPDYLLIPFSTALGWVFRGSAGAANDWWHTRNGGQNGSASPTGSPSSGPQ